MKKLICSLLCAVSLVGCSNQLGIDGEVFVENGGNASKLALVDIQIIPEEAFKAHIKQQLSKADIEENRLQEYINEQEENLARIRQTAGDVMANTMAVGSYGALATSSMLMNQASAAVSNTEKSLEESRAEIKGLKSGANSRFYYPTDLKDEIQKVTSNAEGKFTISIPKGTRSVLAAVKDDKYWIILLDPSKTKKTIALTNKNLNGTSCEECFFTQSTTPGSL